MSICLMHRLCREPSGGLCDMFLLCCRPLYLVTNMSGREYPRWANHFDPYSPIYSRRERSEILVSDCALGLAFSGFFSLAKAFGWMWLTKVTASHRSPFTGAAGLSSLDISSLYPLARWPVCIAAASAGQITCWPCSAEDVRSADRRLVCFCRCTSCPI